VNFTGDTQDAFTSLYDTDNRELNQLQGRWLTPDPAHSGWNLYAYVLNNPQILGWSPAFRLGCYGANTGTVRYDSGHIKHQAPSQFGATRSPFAAIPRVSDGR
jgi:hypothetical protein